MLTFSPKPVPFLSAIKILFTRRVWLAVEYNEVGVPAKAGIAYDKPKDALLFTDEVREEQARIYEKVQEGLRLLEQAKQESKSMLRRPVDEAREQVRQIAEEFATVAGMSTEEAEECINTAVEFDPSPAPMFSTRYEPPAVKMGRKERRKARRNK